MRSGERACYVKNEPTEVEHEAVVQLAEEEKDFPLDVDEVPVHDWVLAIHIHGRSLSDLKGCNHPRFPLRVVRHVARIADLYNDEATYLGVREGSIIVLVAVPAHHGETTLERLQGPELQKICDFAPGRGECSVTAERTHDLSVHKPGFPWPALGVVVICSLFVLREIVSRSRKAIKASGPNQMHVGPAKEEPVAEKPEEVRSVGSISTAVPDDLQASP
jgi:hypothetical protein